VHGEEERGVELWLAGDLGDRADLLVPATCLEQLGRAGLDVTSVRRELAFTDE